MAEALHVNKTNTPWTYQGTLELDGTPTWGYIGTYSGGGYVAELGIRKETANTMVQYLKSTRWLDRLSRALFVEFNLYNPNTNLFTVVSLLFEFPNSGGVLNKPIIQTLRLYYYVGPAALYRLILEVIFAIFTLYFIIREGKNMKQEGYQYFHSFWNILEFLNIVGAIAAIALYGCHYVFTRLTLTKFQENKGSACCIEFKYFNSD